MKRFLSVIQNDLSPLYTVFRFFYLLFLEIFPAVEKFGLLLAFATTIILFQIIIAVGLYWHYFLAFFLHQVTNGLRNRQLQLNENGCSKYFTNFSAIAYCMPIY